MHELIQIIENSVSRNDLPFAVAMVEDRHGVWWSGAAGEASPGRAATVDTIFRAYSMTKAIGSTAAMILMDRGQLDPDATVESILPEFGDVKLLESLTPQGAVLRAPAVKATVRHLASHTAGLGYELWNDAIAAYQSATGAPPISSGLKRSLFSYPLQFEPGTQWIYGIGIDWLGQIVERIDGRPIDVFCRQEIFEPLGMRDSYFRRDPAWSDRLAQLKMRAEDGAFVDFELSPPEEPEFYGAGTALYATPSDFMRFLRMYLNEGTVDGNRILGRDTLRACLKSQTGPVAIEASRSTNPAVSADLDILPGWRKSHSMAFMRVEEDIPGMRSAGSQTWAGLLNTHFWFDPASDVAAVLMTQSVPFIEPRFIKTYEAFERAVYAHVRSQRSPG